MSEKGTRKNRYIPFRKSDIVKMCLKEARLPEGNFDDFKEAVLAYYFLLTTKQDLTKRQLDDAIEKWFEDKWNIYVDFEIDDAMKKLERLELVSRDGDILCCKPLSEAKRQLDDIWDNYFNYSSLN